MRTDGTTVVAAIDCRGRVEHVTDRAPTMEGGIAVAPPGFGAFGGDILVGNFGNGRINAYEPTTGEFQGELSSPGGGPITIDGLWGLRFAPATPGATANTLFFTAGLNDEADGLFGTIVPNG